MPIERITPAPAVPRTLRAKAICTQIITSSSARAAPVVHRVLYGAPGGVSAGRTSDRLHVHWPHGLQTRIAGSRLLTDQNPSTSISGSSIHTLLKRFGQLPPNLSETVRELDDGTEPGLQAFSGAFLSFQSAARARPRAGADTRTINR